MSIELNSTSTEITAAIRTPTTAATNFNITTPATASATTPCTDTTSTITPFSNGTYTTTTPPPTIATINSITPPPGTSTITPCNASTSAASSFSIATNTEINLAMTTPKTVTGNYNTSTAATTNIATPYTSTASTSIASTSATATTPIHRAKTSRAEENDNTDGGSTSKKRKINTETDVTSLLTPSRTSCGIGSSGGGGGNKTTSEKQSDVNHYHILDTTMNSAGKTTIEMTNINPFLTNQKLIQMYNHHGCTADKVASPQSQQQIHPLYHSGFRDKKRWMKMFQKLVEYKTIHKNTLVRQKYKEDPYLGQWVSRQRQSHNKGEMHPNKVVLLNSIDFVWAV